jgi:lambda family phage minor tail protein L
MAIPVSELQKLNPSSRIELFVMELVEGLHYASGNPSSVPTTFRFHAGSNMNTNAELIWQGNTYQRLPITFEGTEFKGTGQVPRPTLTVANLGGITRSGSVLTVTDLMIIVNLTTPHNDLVDAKITRITTLASELDAANFPGSSNPFGTPSSNELPQEIFFIDRKTSESRDIVQFELVGALDQANLKLPKRQVTRNEFAGVGTFINT